MIQGAQGVHTSGEVPGRVAVGGFRLAQVAVAVGELVGEFGFVEVADPVGFLARTVLFPRGFGFGERGHAVACGAGHRCGGARLHGGELGLQQWLGVVVDAVAGGPGSRFPRGRAEFADEVVDYVARQVKVPASELGLYDWTGRTIEYHCAQIRDHLGFRVCGVVDAEKLTQWLMAGVAHAERHPDRVREELLRHCREERIEPRPCWRSAAPSAPRSYRPLPARPRPATRDRRGPERGGVLERRQRRHLLGKGGEISTNRREEVERGALCLRILQALLVYVNTLMLQDVLAEDVWANTLSPADRRGLTPLFWSHVRPYGEVRLDMGSRLAIGAAR